MLTCFRYALSVQWRLAIMSAKLSLSSATLTRSSSWVQSIIRYYSSIMAFFLPMPRFPSILNFSLIKVSNTFHSLLSSLSLSFFPSPLLSFFLYLPLIYSLFISPLPLFPIPLSTPLISPSFSYSCYIVN